MELTPAVGDDANLSGLVVLARFVSLAIQLRMGPFPDGEIRIHHAGLQPGCGAGV